MIAGKWQLNGRSGNKKKWPGYDDNSRPFKAGFDEYCLWQLTELGSRFWDPLIEENGGMIPQEKLKGKYGPDYFTDYICNFIERNKAEPFFVYYPMVLVHSPFIHTPDSKSKEINEQEAFADMVAYSDKLVGRIVKKLEDEKLLKNTIIIFTGDNGTHKKIKSYIGKSLIKGGKGTTPDAGTHVPLIAYWKGHSPVGKVSDDLIDFTDFLPTFAEAAGASIPDMLKLDGLSFLPTLKGKKGETREWVFCYYDPKWGKYKMSAFARTERFKLYHDGRFYDVPNDVLEKNQIVVNDGEIELMSSNRERLQKILNSMPYEK